MCSPAHRKIRGVRPTLHFVQTIRVARSQRHTRGEPFRGTPPAIGDVLPGAASHRGFDGVGLDTIHAIVAEADDLFRDHGIPYLVIGGQASAALGRPRASGDVDLFVAPQDARRALQTLADAGFDTDETNPHWIFKGVKNGVLLDLMFKMKGDVYLDAEMLARAPHHDVGGRRVPMLPPEDLIVVKSFAHDEESSRHWFDALAIIARGPIDWEYLLRRAQKGPRRVMSLLVYATSSDLVVPATIIRRLYDMAFTETAP